MNLRILTSMGVVLALAGCGGDPVAESSSGSAGATLVPPAPATVSACAASVPGDGVVPYPVAPAVAPFALVDGLYQRPEGRALALVGTNDGVANAYTEPFVGSLGGRFLLFHRGSHATLQGQGYLSVRWETAYFNRGGVVTALVAPNFELLSGSLTKVALAGRYMPDPEMDGEPGESGTWRAGWQTPGVEYVPFTTPPGVIDGVPSLWINEYYHLDGQVKITNRESGADYNIGLTPVTWQTVRNDLVNTRARALNTVARTAVSIDPYLGDSKPGSPVALSASAVGASVADLAWTDCSDTERGFLVEASYGGVFGGKAYAAGELYTTAESMPANTSTVRLGTLSPSTHYFFRVKSFNEAGDSVYSNVVELTTPPAAASPPSPWLWQDVAPATTPVAIPGRVELHEGRYTLQVGSADLWGTADSFHFVYQPLNGDGRITARVLDLSQTRGTAKAGVMIRESLTAGSRYAMSRIYANGGVQGQRREQTGAGSAAEGSVQSAGNGSGPHWLRLTRRGSVFTTESSPDGVIWTTLGTRTVAMTAQVYIGLALSSLSGKLGTATFDNVTITSP